MAPWHAEDHGAYLPSRRQIRAACRRIRLLGYQGETGWHDPWTEHDYQRRAGVVQGDVIPEATERDLGLGHGREDRP